MRPVRIALTTGDPAGIGPELVARLLADLTQGLSPATLGSGALPESRERDSRFIRQSPDHLGTPAAGPQPDIAVVTTVSELQAGIERSGLAVDAAQLLAAPNVKLIEHDGAECAVVGEASAAGGAWALRGLELALAECKAGRADAVVFGPLNKSSLHLAGMSEPDELRWLEKACGSSAPVSEVNVGAAFWTARVTSHVAFRAVADLITPEKVADACRLLAGLLRADGNPNPQIGVCALNPHAGESGRFGDEEQRRIAPGIELARSQGVSVRGPYPADAIFRLGYDGEFDGIVTMYHDQG
ncbi:MAG: 4-hydroxythreonine-4-phosphate dehydrogenase PdxA, partial [Propionibacteriaceae bacterium]|nr:4-hydroxythreonine-4-phosphate dehydrogenase PdxA [Propionibacteriaceae bacterium]